MNLPDSSSTSPTPSTTLAATAGNGDAPPPRAMWAQLRRSTLFYPLVGLIVVCIAMMIASPSFLSAANLENVLRQVSINAIIAVGMTCVILTGGIDLSVGSVMALSGTLAAGLMVAGVNAVAALAIGIAVGLGFGFLNGVFVAFAGMPPIIVTLATMGIARGLALIYTGGYPIDGLPDWVAFFGSGKVLGIQAPVLIMLVVYAIAWLLLDRMPFGRYVYAIGGNEHSAVLMGLPVRSTLVGVYTLSGFCSALAGVVFTFYMLSGYGLHAVGLELDAIAAVVIGGTLLSGGVGYVLGTLFGVLMLGIIQTLIMFDGSLSSWWTRIVIGGLLFVFCLLQRLFESRRR